MKASRRRSINVLILALVIAITGAAMLLATPKNYGVVVLKTSLANAEDIKPLILPEPLRLNNAMRLEAGANLRAVTAAGPDSSDQVQPLRAGKSYLVTNATLTLELAASSRSHSNQASAEIPVSGFDSLMQKALNHTQFQNVYIEDALLQFELPGGALKPAGRITVTIVSERDAKALKIAGHIKRNDETVTIDATLTKAGDNDGVQDIDIKLSNPNFSLKAIGSLSTNEGLRVVSENANLSAKSLKDLLGWIGMGEIKSNGLETFTSNGQFTWNGTAIAFNNATFMLDNNPASGSINFNLAPQQPAIDGTLAFDRLDLAPYLKNPNQLTMGEVLATNWAGIQSEAKLNSLPLGLKDINADFRLSTKSLRLNGSEIGRGAAVVISKRGRLKIDFVELVFSTGVSGRAHLEVDVNNSRPSYLIRGDFKNVDLGQVSNQLLGKSVVDGIADTTFDVSAKGSSRQDMINTMSGPIHIFAPNGASVPIDLNNFFEQTKSAPNDGWAGFKPGFTALKNLSIELQSQRGALKTRSVTADLSDDFAFIASGTIKLSDLMVDLIVKKVSSGKADDFDTQTSIKTNEDAVQLKGPILEPIIRAARPLKRS